MTTEFRYCFLTSAGIPDVEKRRIRSQLGEPTISRRECGGDQACSLIDAGCRGPKGSAKWETRDHVAGGRAGSDMSISCRSWSRMAIGMRRRAV